MGRLYLYLLKVGGLRVRIHPTLNDLNNKRHVLANEPRYRFILILIIFLFGICDVIVLESMTTYPYNSGLRD